MDTLIDEFSSKIAKEVELQQKVRNGELIRYQDILKFLRTWDHIYPQVINLNNLEKSTILKKCWR